MRLDELDFQLPPESIAHEPLEPRDQSRLLVYYRQSDRVEHHRFYELPQLLRPDDLMIFNDTQVLPARLELHKPTGSRIPGLFLSEKQPGLWQVMLRSRGRAGPGQILLSPDGQSQFKLLERLAGKGQWLVEVTPPEPALLLLGRIGQIPLPPYIHRKEERPSDRQRYQTVYAQKPGALAAPTAGLHFTPELLSALAARGIQRQAVTLHVGLGTFLPVETATLEEHPMHAESYRVERQTVEALRRQRQAGQRIVVVGTTAVRTLESTAQSILGTQEAQDLEGSTRLLIQPGYDLALTDVLITNFHLPRSTLLALVAALVGMEKLKSLYAMAIEQGYRFYSYGDAMIVL